MKLKLIILTAIFFASFLILFKTAFRQNSSTILGTSDKCCPPLTPCPDCEIPTITCPPCPTITICPTPTPTPTTGPSATPTSTIPSPTPTFIPTPTLTPYPTSEPTPTATIIPTPTATPTLQPTPMPTSTPPPTATFTPGPTNTPGPEPTNTPAPEPTETVIPQITSPLVQGIIATITPSKIEVEEEFNPLIEGIRKSFSRVLGAKRLPDTGIEDGQKSEEKLPSGNILQEGKRLIIPKIGLNQPLYQSLPIGQEFIIGHQEIIETKIDSSIIIYGHNDTANFEMIRKLNRGDSILYQNNDDLFLYKVDSVTRVSKNYYQVLENNNPNSIILITCDIWNPYLRVIIKAEKITNNEKNNSKN